MIEREKMLLRQIAKLEDAVDRLQNALWQIKRWGDAYPLEVFPEPDFKKAHALLQAGGMTIDSISASTIRFAITRAVEIATKALADES